MDEPHTAASQRAVTAFERPRRVVVGVAGSIAAYKAPFVIRLLRQAGHEVKGVATEAALRLIGAPALAAVSGRAVSTGVFDDPAAVEHVSVAEWAELVVVAPASADLLARVRAGRADDMLTATILTCQAPVVLAPAMHTQMWVNPATRENVAVLRERGLTVIEPDSGRLTGKDSGVGRMPEPEQIVSQALATLTQPVAEGAAAQDALGEKNRRLEGRHLVISAGGTREPIDPVRYLGNRSSGHQGCALAAAAVEQSAGWGRQMAVTGQGLRGYLVVKTGTAVGTAALPVTVVLTAGALTDSRMEGWVWAVSPLICLIGVLPFVLWGLAAGMWLPSSASIGIATSLVSLFAFIGNAFMPLSHTLLTISRFTPMYGATALARWPLGEGWAYVPDRQAGVQDPLWMPLANLVVWTLIFGLLVIGARRRATRRR